MLTPADIEHKQFTTTRLSQGYDQDEVDDFLDSAAAALADALNRASAAEAEASTVKSRLALVQRQLDTYGSIPTQSVPVVTSLLATPQEPVADAVTGVSRILAIAQQAADQQLAEANAKAAGLVSEATGKANALLGQATQDADAAKTRAQGELYTVQQKLQELKNTHETLRQFLVQNVTNLQTALEGAPNA